MDKRANAGGAATLIFIMGLIVLIYILTLPDDVRQDLFPGTPPLSGGNSGNDGTTYPEGDSNILLEEHPGLISYLEFNEREIPLTPFTVMTTKKSEVLSQYYRLKLIRGFLTNQNKEINFYIDKDLVNDVLLTFNVEQTNGGELRIILNGEVILEKAFEPGSVSPITLPNNLLKENNTLILEVSPPGLAFWRVNEYVLSNIVVAASVVDDSSSKAVIQFNIPHDEYNNIESSELRFIAECQLEGRAPLYIKLNGDQLYDGIPECGITTRVLVPKAYLLSGINSISFSSKSRYSVHNARIVLTYYEPDYPLYFFNVPKDFFYNPNTDNETLKPGIKVKLKLVFGDDNYKKAVISVNGYKMRVDTYATEWERDISDYIYSGANSIKIIPEKSGLVVNKLIVSYEKFYVVP